MATILSPLVLAVKMFYLLEGQRAMNVFHVGNSVEWTEGTAQLVVDGFYDWWVAEIKASQHMGCVLQLIEGTQLSDAAGFVVTHATDLPQAGGNSGPPAPNNISCAFSWHTSRRGRSYRGRTYHMGFTKDQTTNSELASGVNEGLRESYEDLLTAVPAMTSDAYLGVLSLVTGGAPRSVGLIEAIVSVSSDGIVDSQRRRLPGRGA